MNDPLVVLLITTLLIVLSGFFVIIEFAMIGARRHRLEAEASTSRSARAALRGINELTVMLAGAQLGITAATFALGAVTKPAVDYRLGPILDAAGMPGWLAGGTSFALSLMFVTFLHLVVGEMAPKSWAIAHPERAAKLVALPARAFVWVVRPLLLGVNNLANRLVRASGITPVDRAAAGGRDADTIRQLVEQSASEGALDASSQSQISDAIELQQLTVGDLVPEGQEPAAVGVDATVREAQKVAARSGHLRILLSTPEGGLPAVVHVRDTLNQEPDESVRPTARPAFVLTRDTPAYDALGRMRESAEHLCVVADGDDVVGLISVQDILRRVLPTAEQPA